MRESVNAISARGCTKMVMLFRPEHVAPILDGVKTQTRRLWDRPRVKAGNTYQARTTLLKRDSTFALITVKRVWKERLRDISGIDAAREGYASETAFWEAFARINGKDVTQELLDTEVWAIEFEAEGVMA